MLEIERKFLVKNTDFLQGMSGTEIVQGYILAAEKRVCRVRIAGAQAFLTLKKSADGIVRSEFEYSIPVEDAREILELLCGERVLRKTRYEVVCADHTWEIDVFHGKRRGLIIAEIELDRPDEDFEMPDWVGTEVSSDSRYYNASLACESGLPPFKGGANRDE